jgi:hypothetical protein
MSNSIRPARPGTGYFMFISSSPGGSLSTISWSSMETINSSDQGDQVLMAVTGHGQNIMCPCFKDAGYFPHYPIIDGNRPLADQVDQVELVRLRCSGRSRA